MKKILIILLSISLFGCSLGQENHTKSDQLTTGVDGFVEPEPTEWVKFIKPVRTWSGNPLYFNAEMKATICMILKA